MGRVDDVLAEAVFVCVSRWVFGVAVVLSVVLSGFGFEDVVFGRIVDDVFVFVSREWA